MMGETISDPTATFVFVSLGLNPAPTLSLFAQRALEQLPGSRAILVTDRPAHWDSTFPGSVIRYTGEDRDSAVLMAEKREISRRLVANGYWILTLERIFALRCAVQQSVSSEPLIHLESDSLSQVNSEVLDQLKARCSKIAVPSDAPGSGCASILFAPNADSLRQGLDELSTLLGRQTEWISDMELLGLGIDAGLVEELPTRPSMGWTIPPKTGSTAPRLLIFDALALGLYLFGRDPLHTDGEILGGYQHARFEVELNTWEWRLRASEGPKPRRYTVEGSTAPFTSILPGNLHVHSKELIPEINPESEYWSRLLDEANGLTARTARTGISPYRFQRLPIWKRVVFFQSKTRSEKRDLVRALLRKVLRAILVRRDRRRKW